MPPEEFRYEAMTAAVVACAAFAIPVVGMVLLYLFA